MTGTFKPFVRDYNLFLKDLLTNEEKQITFDGKANEILNGIPDWIYKEEFHLEECFKVSPDCTKVAYFKFDLRKVPEVIVIKNDQPIKKRYPKAGERNPLVSIYVYSVSEDISYFIDTSLIDSEDTDYYISSSLIDSEDTDYCISNSLIDSEDTSITDDYISSQNTSINDGYIPRIYWIKNELIVLKLNRSQTRLEFICYNIINDTHELIFVEENERWIEIRDDYFFFENGDMILCSERSGFNHIYFISTVPKLRTVNIDKEIRKITKGEWEVDEISYVDVSNKLIFYLSNESGIINRDLYVIDFDGKNKQLLTYTINSYQLIQPSLIKSFNQSKRKIFSFITEDRIELIGWMLKPKDFSSTKKYPALVYCYGGPGSRLVQNNFDNILHFDFFLQLSRLGYFVVCVDGRGSGGRGEEFKKCIYEQIGKYECYDQIQLGKYLSSLSFIDGNRIGIWGWSFGGYLASLTKFISGNLFKAAIAVAPVSDWRFYDSIYTERYMRKPKENLTGYKNSSLLLYTKNVKGSFFLIHGTADDNVLVENSFALTSSLKKNKKTFQYWFIENENHYLLFNQNAEKIYRKMIEFLLSFCF
jgi:dipeptidyl-peptidase-4